MNRVWTGTAVFLAVVAGVMVNVQHVRAVDSAVVIDSDGLCGMVGSDADGNMIIEGVGARVMKLENGNKVTMKCHGTGVPNASGVGQSWNGFLCGLLSPDNVFIVTDDTHATVSASGVGSMTCTFRKPETTR